MSKPITEEEIYKMLENEYKDNPWFRRLVHRSIKLMIMPYIVILAVAINISILIYIGGLSLPILSVLITILVVAFALHYMASYTIRLAGYYLFIVYDLSMRKVSNQKAGAVQNEEA